MIIPPVLFGIILVAGLLAAVFWLASNQKKRRKEFEEKYGSSRSPVFHEVPSDEWFVLPNWTSVVRFKFKPEKVRNRVVEPSWLFVQTEGDILGNVRLRKSTKWDFLGAKLGLAEFVDTGDADFDSLVVVEAEVENYAAELLQFSEVKEAVAKVFLAGFHELEWSATGGFIRAIWPSYQADPGRDPKVLFVAAENLQVLLKASLGKLPGPLAKWVGRKRFGHLWFRVNLAALLIGIVGGYFYINFLGYPLAGTWSDAFEASSHLLTLYLITNAYVAWYCFRKTPQGHSLIFIGWCLSVGIACSAVYPVYFFLNGWLDDGPLGKSEFLIRGTEVFRGYHFDFHYIRIDSQVGGRRVGSFRVSKEDFLPILQGENNVVEIVYGNGKFGYPWVKAMYFHHKDLAQFLKEKKDKP